MIDNIKQFLNIRKKKIARLKLCPVVIRWLESPGMNQSLEIIDKRVGYLLQCGAIKKLDQWFLAGDENFNAITAERYILAYLGQKNKSLEDNLHTVGIDGFLTDKFDRIGVEITTLNGFVTDWIFIERLTEALDQKNYLTSDRGLEISYSHDIIRRETQGRMIYSYIAKTAEAIISADTQSLSELNIIVEQHSYGSGISFNLIDTDSYPWFGYITKELMDKLQHKKKVQQLTQQTRNIVFVGLNHSSSSNWAFPRIFEDLVKSENRYKPEIQEIREFWASSMSKLTKVNGVCYFFYSLDREIPFYPLKFFWRSEKDKIAINL